TVNPNDLLSNNGAVQARIALPTSNGAFSIGSTANDMVIRTETTGQKILLTTGAGSPTAVFNNGNVGIGTTGPENRLHVFVNGSADGINVDGGVNPNFLLSNNGTVRARMALPTSSGAFSLGAAANDLVIRTESATQKIFLTTGGGSPTAVFNNGNVGIGTTTPTARLDVNGDANVSGNATVAGNIGAKYQDVAEWVETAEPLEPGTVVIVDPAASNRVVPARRAYDTRVAGAVSKQPGLILGESGDTKTM